MAYVMVYGMAVRAKKHSEAFRKFEKYLAVKGIRCLRKESTLEKGVNKIQVMHN
ncbi:MAG: hypothetical protein AABX93_02785 [Nanoarchaeota archaeon]